MDVAFNKKASQARDAFLSSTTMGFRSGEKYYGLIHINFKLFGPVNFKQLSLSLSLSLPLSLSYTHTHTHTHVV